MATYTANYGLHQWVPEDNFIRTDFNEDLLKIDTAMGELESGKADNETVEQNLNTINGSIIQLTNGKCMIYSGSYTGNGAASRTINLGFQPRAVLVENATGTRYQNGISNGGLAVAGQGAVINGKKLVTVLYNGFEVYYQSGSVQTNASSTQYRYMAFV